MQNDFEWLDTAYQHLTEKMEAQCYRTGTSIPFIPRAGRYQDCMMPGGVAWWTNGFWPGILWQMYHATGNEIYRKAAQEVDARIAQALAQGQELDHDVGFLYQLSAAAEYQLTGSKSALGWGLHAATLLAGRFNCQGQFLRAWEPHYWKEDVSGWMIVDCLMNVSLLYWASEQTSDPRFADIARRHTETARRYLLRPDGSCAHIASFDPATGEFIGTLAGQGYAADSSWSRGQGWSVYGFALAYRHTREAAFLEAAKRSAHYCIASLAASDWLPLLDFRAPAEPVRYDSGAGVLLACGFLELADWVGDTEKPIYQKAAMRVLRATCEAFADWNAEQDGILDQGATRYYDDRLGSQKYIYNDYFLTEAILRLKNKHFMIW